MKILKIDNQEFEFDSQKDLNLLELLQINNKIIESPCSGKGYCGKCKVKILNGILEKPSQEELKFLTNKEIQEGIRLSCFLYPKEDLEVERIKIDESAKVLSDGYMPEFKLDPSVTKRKINLKKPTLINNFSYEEMVRSYLKENEIINSGLILKDLSNLSDVDEATLVFYENELIHIEAMDTTEKIYSLAVDIGTTTVVASLLDLNLAIEIDSKTAINPQKEYGLDVLSRIDFIKRNVEGLNILQNSIVNCLNKLIEDLCAENNISKDNIYEVAVGANATMMHILLGVNTATIGKSPYSTIFSNQQIIPSNQIGIKIAKNGKLYCLAGVSSYIGADIVAGAVVSDLKNKKGNIFFIDIGTNGEMILSKENKLVSCSCAAGPALEGANITCGMRASNGAIEGVMIKEGKIDLQIIGDKEPIGLCGSGILEAICQMFDSGVINKSGRINKSDKLREASKSYLANNIIEEDKKRKFILSRQKEKNIIITQEDVRQVQLAKGAISSGFYALLQHMNMKEEDVDEVIIAGQFGKHLKADSLTGLGIIPKNLEKKVTYIGNSSKTGAMMCLFSKKSRKEIEKIAKEIYYFELSTQEGYEKLFTKCLSFG